ncbi:hypothetical protein LL912_14985 [Niabella sp. CC-SYL272]|uniref:hypothetical protein n=1 Tax=Niabella agricola TaxID=2891571 RepID=UPI001F308FD7|nr:hypothetical protein [Niabella agricola]MCF3110085.1 hypothetical protein [Niabella agricola]
MTATKKSPSLLFCILMDIIGCLSFTIPGIGEFADVIWAPVSAIILAKAFGGTRGMFGGVFNFIEEALPGTDIIPTFTIMWLLTNKVPFFHKKGTVIPVKSR